MINIKYLKYIPKEKQEDVYKSMIEDIYYFYYGIRPNNKQKIIIINKNKYDLRKENLIIIIE